MTNTTNNTVNNTSTKPCTPEFIAPAPKKNFSASLKEKTTAIISDVKTNGLSKSVKKNLNSLIAIALAVIVVISTVAILSSVNAYKTAVKKTVEHVIGKNALYVTKTIPDCVWKDYAGDDSVLQVKLEAIGYSFEHREDMRNSFDDISYEIDDYDELRDREVEDMKEILEYCYDSIDEDDIGDKMYETTVTIEYEIDGITYEEEHDIFVVEINGDWFVVSEYGSFVNVI